MRNENKYWYVVLKISKYVYKCRDAIRYKMSKLTGSVCHLSNSKNPLMIIILPMFLAFLTSSLLLKLT